MAHRAVFETKPGVRFLITPDFIEGFTLTFTTYHSEDNKELIYDQNPPFTKLLQYQGYYPPHDYYNYLTKEYIPGKPLTTDNTKTSKQQSLLSIIQLLDLTEHKRLYWYKL